MPRDVALDQTLLRKLEALRLAVRWVRWGTRAGGRFAINRRGSSIEFADYAAYTPGDDIRAIDWNLYARSDRLFVKTYKEEVELSVEVLIDATASMDMPTPEKFRRACQLALALSYIAVAGRHRVRMTAIAPGTVRTSAWVTRRQELPRLVEWVQRLAPGGQVSFGDWMQQTLAVLRTRGGQVLVVSDGMMAPAEFFRAMQLLLARHVEIKIAQVLTTQECHPAQLMRGGVVVDSETGASHELGYSAAELERAVMEHTEQLARFCKRHGIPFAQHRIEESLESGLLKTLLERGFFT